MRALNYKERLFAMYYVGEAKGNARLAAEMAGYSPGMGSNLLRRPLIAMLVQRKTESAAMSADEILARLSDMASYDPDDFLTVTQEEDELDDEGNVKKKGKQRIAFDYLKAKSRGKLGCIKKLEVLPDGGIRFEPHDAQSALEKLMKYHGLGRERLEITQITHDADTIQRVTAILRGISVLTRVPGDREGICPPEPGALGRDYERGAVGTGETLSLPERETESGGGREHQPPSDHVSTEAREIDPVIDQPPGMVSGEVPE